MIQRLARLIAVLGMAVLAVCLGPTPAEAAAPPWTVTNPDPNGAFTVTVQTMVLRNTNTGDTVTCSTPPASHGRLPSATYSQSAPQIGELWADYSCRDARGAAVTLHQLPWRFHPESYDAAAGRTSGFILSHVFSPFLVERPGCTYRVQEFFDPATLLEFTYHNASSTLAVDGASLTLADVSGSGCPGVAHKDDVVTFSATYTVSPAVTIVGS